MAMTLFELNEITTRSLFNKLQGYKARMQREYEDHWQRTRLMCFYAFSPIDPNDPEKKTLMPVTEFMPLPFDDDAVESSFEKIKADAEEKRKLSNKVWSKIDN